jgi:glycosyltransferase involved in cell wall biosynthesis
MEGWEVEVSPGQKIEIAIDARSLVTAPTGIGHYLLAAVNTWSEQSPGVDFILMAHRPIHPAARLLLTGAKNVRWVESGSGFARRNGVWWFMFTFATAARACGVTHLWGASGQLPLWGMGAMTKILTVHDLVFKQMPWTMSIRNRLAYGLLAGRALLKADYLWSVSRFTLGEVDRHYRCPPTQVRIVGSGINPLRKGARGRPGPARHTVNRKTLLFVGTLEPRKNLSHLLALMPELARHGVSLLVVGAKGWGQQAFAQLLKAPGYPVEQVVFADYVADEDLQDMYVHAGALVCPSLLEGFGLPMAEAMAEGCPVVAANNSSLPEVVGEGGIIVSGWEIRDWVAAVLQVLESRDKYAQAAQRMSQIHDMANPCRELMRQLTAVPGVA